MKPLPTPSELPPLLADPRIADAEALRYFLFECPAAKSDAILRSRSFIDPSHSGKSIRKAILARSLATKAARKRYDVLFIRTTNIHAALLEAEQLANNWM